jgi:hypothetical protein
VTSLRSGSVQLCQPQIRPGTKCLKQSPLAEISTDVCEISGCHGGEYGDESLQGYIAV